MSGFETPEMFTDVFTLDLADETASRILGEDVAIILRVGDIVALSGDLGAGKTTLARAMLRYLAQDDEMDVPSPTYTLVQSYETRPKATHFDLYRIGSEEELAELGFDEAAETGLVLVEWPERAALVSAESNLHLHLDLSRGGGRRLVARTTAESARRLSRSLAIRRFLEGAGYPLARRRAFPADASARRYERLVTADGENLILMDSPAVARGTVLRDNRSYAEIAHLAQDVVPFVALAQALLEAGFSVPKVVESDLESGLVLLEDLGAEGIVDGDGRPIASRYQAAAHCLARLHETPIEPDLPVRGGGAHHVPPFDREAMEIEVDLLPSWFLPRLTGRAADEGQMQAFRGVWTVLFDRLEAGEKGLVLRDFHSPNILWQSERDDCRRIGILDFQDAMIGPVAYDLASLAQDARVDISPELQDAIVRSYKDERRRGDVPFDEAAFDRDYAVMAAQRATKILGIFVRLLERDGKPQYLRHVPRLQAYLRQTLEHPVLADLKTLYDGWGVLAPLP